MENFTIRIEARRLAEELFAQARENELKITADLQKIASEVDAKIIGLENRFKTEESLVRKLSLLADRDKSKQFVQHKFEKFARRNNDTLRYTFILSNDKYAEDFYNTVETLKQNGFLIPQNRIWNAWENAETAKDTGYRGINITVISSQKQRFELQFHTAESFRLKTETHHLYEQLRNLKTSDERRAEIIKEILKSAKQVERPEGI
jgi:hypothetical protein